MQRSTLAIAGIAVLAVAFGTAACGGSSSASSTQTATTNGEDSKTADQIIGDARAAADSASSVHLTGQVPQSRTPIMVDLHLSATHAATGTLEFNGATADVVRVGSTVYVKGPLSFYAVVGAPAAAIVQLAGKWVRAPIASSALSPFRSFFALTDFHQLMATVLTPTALPIAKAGTGTVNGTQVVYLTDAKKDGLAISLVGTPYPVAVIPPPGQQGQLTFSGWDAPIDVTAPAGAINLSTLGG